MRVANTINGLIAKKAMRLKMRPEQVTVVAQISTVNDELYSGTVHYDTSLDAVVLSVEGQKTPFYIEPTAIVAIQEVL